MIMIGNARLRLVGNVLSIVVLMLAAAPAPGPGPVRAQDEAGWAGKRVVARSAGLVLRVDDEPVEPSRGAIVIYRVERVDEGPALWLRAEGRRLAGWARADEVIPVESAEAFYSGRIRARPQDAFPHMMRGLIRHDRGDIAGALGDYDEAVRLGPTSPTAFRKRGEAWAARGQFDRAIADYDAAIRLDGKESAAYLGRGDARARVGDLDRAIEDYSEAIWLDPLALTAYAHRGRAWHAKREYEKAVIDFNMVIRLEPENRSAFLDRARAWQALKAYGKAIADLDEAIRLEPEEPEAQDRRGWIGATCSDARYRDGPKAVAAATKACAAAGWKNPSFLATLAAASAEAGDFESAVKWQIRANALFADAQDKAKGQARLALYRERKPYREG
jgi:tetratricopeptide (TPR) repeat protein